MANKIMFNTENPFLKIKSPTSTTAKMNKTVKLFICVKNRMYRINVPHRYSPKCVNLKKAAAGRCKTLCDSIPKIPKPIKLNARIKIGITKRNKAWSFWYMCQFLLNRKTTGYRPVRTGNNMGR
jgi:hypothetical protein